MSICDWLSDRMPSAALAEAEWTPEEARHFGQCPSCQAEWRLIQATRRLGSRVRLVPDPDSTAQAVLLRLGRAEKRSPVRWWGLSALAAAAIAAAVWAGGQDTSANPEPRSVAAGVPMPLPELDVLQVAELDSVLTTMDDSSAGAQLEEDVGLRDLDTEELQRVLDTWEG